MKAEEYIKQFKKVNEDSLISYEALVELMEGFSEQQNKELIESHKRTLQLLSDVAHGKVEINRATVLGRLKKYIESHLQDLKKNES